MCYDGFAGIRNYGTVGSTVELGVAIAVATAGSGYSLNLQVADLRISQTHASNLALRCYRYIPNPKAQNSPKAL